MSTFDRVVVKALTDDQLLLAQTLYWVGQNQALAEPDALKALVMDRLSGVDWSAVHKGLVTQARALRARSERKVEWVREVLVGDTEDSFDTWLDGEVKP